MKRIAGVTGRTMSGFISFLGFLVLPFLLPSFTSNSYAETSSSPIRAVSLSGAGGGTTAAVSGGAANVTGSGTLTPDLFSGTMSYSIPIEVPAGRKGLDPGLALTYRSNNSNGWVGVGWDLEVGAIERGALDGINYSGDDYMLRMAGSGIDLINIGNNEYRSKIESGFLRIKKQTASDGKTYWVVTDKSGLRFFYGQTASTRQDNPSDANKIFK